MGIITEVCADNLNSAITADRAGADRIELCQGLSEGGLTPSPALIRWCSSNLKLGVMVLIRPRGGDFLYNEEEFEIIKEDVRFSREAGAGGVVVGFLDRDGNVDKERLREIVEIAGEMEVVFHRAFDRCRDWEEALEDIISCGCKRILTSGLYDTASEGRENLKQIIERAGERITILAGSGVSSENIEGLYNHINFKEIHFSAKKWMPSQMRFQGASIRPITGHNESEPDEIKTVLAICKKLG
ncbi:copper homeostasis protein CutC [Bacteroidales bacterium]